MFGAGMCQKLKCIPLKVAAEVCPLRPLAVPTGASTGTQSIQQVSPQKTGFMDMLILAGFMYMLRNTMNAVFRIGENKKIQGKKKKKNTHTHNLIKKIIFI